MVLKTLILKIVCLLSRNNFLVFHVFNASFSQKCQDFFVSSKGFMVACRNQITLSIAQIRIMPQLPWNSLNSKLILNKTLKIVFNMLHV